MSSKVKKDVIDFPFYGTRLAPIDYEEIMEVFNSSTVQWEDPRFPADIHALLDDRMNQGSKSRWHDFIWKRPAEVYGEGNFYLFDKIDPNDIQQGHLGDCYFLSSLSSLAEWPDRVKKLFLTQKINDAGIYAVQLVVNGEYRTVVVDDRFPFNPRDQNWAFSRASKTHEIWVQILEKAWAKVYGSYQRVESGNTGEALHPLTGCPTDHHFHADIDPEYLWQQIYQADQHDFVMCAEVASARSSFLGPSDMKTAGLVDQHAYSLLKAVHVEDEKGEKHRLLKIRNPWGRKEWKGDWSDKSDKWTPFMKQKLDFVNKNDGSFWIPFKDYIDFFYLTFLCLQQLPHKPPVPLETMPDIHDHSSFCVTKVSVPEDVHSPASFIVNQIDARHVDDTRLGNYHHMNIAFAVAKVQNSPTGLPEALFIDGHYRAQATLTVVAWHGLPKGDYLVFYKAEQTTGHPYKKLVLGTHLPLSCEMTSLEPSPQMASVFQQLANAVMEREEAGHRYVQPKLF